MVDIIIIGGGPAGLSAGISAKQRNNNTLIITGDIKKNKLYKAARVDNYPGFPGISGAELLVKLTDHARDAGVDMITGKVSNILQTDDAFHVAYDNEIQMAKSIIIATGLSHGSLFPGEEDFLGRGVSYCATCDGMLFREKRVCVVCISADANDEADYLASLGCDILRITSRNIRINGDTKVVSLTVDGIDVPCDGVFIFRDAIAPHLLLPGLETNGAYIKVTPAGETNIPGVYAAGDCVGAPHQISKAVGEGLVAALTASEYIRMQKNKS
ncbi:MAG: FAD-dependent oxidoreductase [Oscillospiraceae bacterium]|nr:FAD-dependent oxidoreductase [Oscillospiraceae bacterium]